METDQNEGVERQLLLQIQRQLSLHVLAGIVSHNISPKVSPIIFYA